MRSQVQLVFQLVCEGGGPLTAEQLAEADRILGR
jgi:hypothetical protein